MTSTATKDPRELRDGERFSTDNGRTWHVCAVPLFGNVAVYLDATRTDASPTTRIATPGPVLVEVADPDITDADESVVRAAVGHGRFAELKGAAINTGRTVAEVLAAELTGAEKARIREALDGAPLDHDAIAAAIGADRYRSIWQGVQMPGTPDAQREAVIRAALAAQLTDAEREALAPAADDDVCPITGLTSAERAALPDAEAAPAPAKRRPTPAGPRASTKRVAGGADGRDWSYVGLVKLGRKVVAECGHLHANRDWPAGVAGGSAKSCAESILDGARRPATAEHTAKRIRTAPLGLRPAAGFQHPAGTIEAAREIAEKNEATYLAAVAAVREHLPTLEEPLPNTEPAAAGESAEAPALLAEDPEAAGLAAAAAEGCLDAGNGHTCSGVVRYRPALTATGVNYPRCDAAWSARLDLQDRNRRDYPDSPVAPSWFTEQGGEAYAGERWDED
jgi:hypothetical protein